MELHLVDLNSELVSEWKNAFKDYSEVEIHLGSILDIASDAIVSPANSHGFMDGGIDLVYLRYFGHQLQDLVRNKIYQRPEEIISVGSAELIETGNVDIPYLIVAPTMEMPQAVPPENAYRAFKAVLRLSSRHPEITDICCPGLCTGVGQVDPKDSAREMAAAYKDWKQKKIEPAN